MGVVWREVSLARHECQGKIQRFENSAFVEIDLLGGDPYWFVQPRSAESKSEILRMLLQCLFASVWTHPNGAIFVRPEFESCRSAKDVASLNLNLFSRNGDGLPPKLTARL
jgi:hypothetical protein